MILNRLLHPSHLIRVTWVTKTISEFDVIKVVRNRPHLNLAGFKGFNGQLEFYIVDELETMATAEHFMAIDIEWDPTGSLFGA
ncbi:hypothetical protein L1987_49409 [Smallanthus sonchifolius]|uniref:Uncharacterized protein n=1 Tax=Smallanthus sonchifolius TaxID=185202 RepID=A0ACB9FUN2_9ASTR|nr:hypothetical protein L1987_49409 [Smallanthus sonchifolius]